MAKLTACRQALERAASRDVRDRRGHAASTDFDAAVRERGSCLTAHAAIRMCAESDDESECGDDRRRHDPQRQRSDGARQRPCAADLPPGAGRVRARQRLPPLRRERPRATSTSSPASACRRSAMRTRASSRRSPRRPRSCCTRRTCTSIRCRRKSRRGSSALSGHAAHVLLQQRHGSGRGVPEVRAPLLARAGHAAHGGRRASSTRSTAGRWERCR